MQADHLYSEAAETDRRSGLTGVNEDPVPDDIFIEPVPVRTDNPPVNGKHGPDDEDDDDAEEDDLILGDEDEITGEEVEYDVELEEDFDEEDIEEDDLVIDTDDEDEEEGDDL